MEKVVIKFCHGPGIVAGAEKCISKNADRAGGHRTDGTGDAAPYNGIRKWRCPECFTEHRRRITEAAKVYESRKQRK